MLRLRTLHELGQIPGNVEGRVEELSRSRSSCSASPSPSLRYLSWDDYFLAIAFLSAQRSKDPNRQVGACLVSQNGVILEIKVRRSFGDKVSKLYLTMFPCNECAKVIIQLEHDTGCLMDCRARLNFSPLGACALAGFGLPIDRFMTSDALGFTAPLRNSDYEDDHISDYEDDLIQMKNLTTEEFVHILHRQSSGFARGSSEFRGVTLHKCGRWEARMGQLVGKK